MAEPTKDIEEALKKTEDIVEKEVVQETERETERETKREKRTEDMELYDKDSSKEDSSEECSSEEVSPEVNSLVESMRRHKKILEDLKAAQQKMKNKEEEKLRKFRADPFSVVESFQKPGKLKRIYTGK